jgi:class 3 adenylate cyclase/tetratricopeptide (TPR) repeat protein
MVCPVCGNANPEGARFCNACAAPLVGAQPVREQRKTVTVVFCDVTGSTALGERLDPEPLRALLARYFERMKGIIEQHGGSVEKFIGDAVMAVFGVPVVHEDDALRAVRAALGMRAALPELGVQARLGIATGEVVVGTAERLATGDVVNLAARLQQAAAPGQILIADTTYRLVREVVSAELMAPLALRGKDRLVEAYRLDAVTGEPIRRHAGRMIGRDRQLRMLRSAFDNAQGDLACCLFTVLGPAGVGKSRLVSEFLLGVDARVVRGRCLSYGEGITYWPVIEVLRELGVQPDDQHAAAAIGELLGEGDSGAASAAEIATAVRRALEQVARDGPLVVVWDDLHWAEAAFLDLIEHVADWSRGAPILLICMARPDLLDRRPGWAGGKLNATTVLLESLTPAETNRLIDSLGAPVGELRDRIRTAADGNPLFVEEMLALVDDAGASDIAVPPTIQALLAARLDQLDHSERAVLERGAVEGQVFHRGAVEALASDELPVGERLLGLVRKELVRPYTAQLPGEEAFRFRHLLIRDAAYDALPKSVRAQLHLRFADWLDEHGRRLAELDEIVGYHLEQAYRYAEEVGGLTADGALLRERAGGRLADAGRRATEREDFSAAINLLSRANELLPSASSRRAEVLIDLGYALIENGRLDEGRAAFHAAGRQGDEVAAARGRVGLVVADNTAAAPQAALLDAIRAEIAVLERFGSDAGLAEAWEFAAMLETWAGRTADARPAYERALRHARATEDRRVERRIIGHRVVQEAWGDVPADEGIRACDGLLRDAVGTALEPYVLGARALHRVRQGHFEKARDDIRRARELLREYGHLLMATSGAQIEAHLELAAGDPGAAEVVARDSYDKLAVMGEHAFRSTVGCYLAWAQLELGQVDEAEHIAAEAVELGADDDLVTQSNARQIQALIHARRGELAEAQRLAREAMATPAPTDSWSERGQASVTLAEVLDTAGQRDQARAAMQEGLALFARKADLAAAEQAKRRLAHLL